MGPALVTASVVGWIWAISQGDDTTFPGGFFAGAVMVLLVAVVCVIRYRNPTDSSGHSHRGMVVDWSSPFGRPR